MKPISISDIASYRMLSQLTFSPSGNHIGVVATKGDLGKNGYRKYIYYADTKTLRFKKLTNGGGEGSYIWLDDTTVVFQRVAEDEDKAAIKSGEELSIFYSISVDGGEGVELFRVPIKATKIKRIDADNLLIIAQHDLARPELAGFSADQRGELLAQHVKNRDFQVADELPFWFNGMGFINKLRNRAYIYNIPKKRLTPVTDAGFNLSEAKVTPCGGAIVFSGVENNKMNAVRREGLFKYTLLSGKIETLIPQGKYTIGSVEVWGSNVVFSATCPKSELDFLSADLYTVPLKGGKPKLFLEVTDDMHCTTGSDCRLGGGIDFKVSGDSLYTITSRDNMSQINQISTSGSVRNMTSYCKDLCFDQFDVCGNRCVTVAMNDVTLQEVYRLDMVTGTTRKLSSFNGRPLADRYVAPCEPLSFVNKDGVRIDGWVLKPMNYTPKKKYPGILDIHGGPRVSFGPVFYHEMQVMAGDGCFVFFCNPRGGATRGDEFANLSGKYGTIDYDDLMEFTDQVLKKYPALDGKRLGVTGGSYGGYMTNWIIGQTHRFAAAASQRSIANWGPFNLVSDITSFGKCAMQADVWSDYEKPWQQSPLKFALNAKTPTLFIHSFEDYRCPHPEASQMYRALLDKKVPARICFFKGENHELSRSGAPKHRIRRLKEITQWLYTYIKP